MVVTDTEAPGVNPDTRERLLRAAAFLFARKGTSGVRNRLFTIEGVVGV
jgi:AcrR family transcriptional regulator